MTADLRWMAVDCLDCSCACQSSPGLRYIEVRFSNCIFHVGIPFCHFKRTRYYWERIGPKDYLEVVEDLSGKDFVWSRNISHPDNLCGCRDCRSVLSANERRATVTFGGDAHSNAAGAVWLCKNDLYSGVKRLGDCEQCGQQIKWVHLMTCCPALCHKCKTTCVVCGLLCPGDFIGKDRICLRCVYHQQEQERCRKQEQRRMEKQTVLNCRQQVKALRSYLRKPDPAVLTSLPTGFGPAPSSPT